MILNAGTLAINKTSSSYNFHGGLFHWSIVLYIYIHMHIFSRVLVTAEGVLDWMIRFIDTLFTQLGTTGNYSAIADLHTLQFTVTYELGISVFTIRIMVTDLSQSHCHFKLHMESSFNSQTPSLPLFCSCNPEDSTQFNSSVPQLISQQAAVPKLDSSLFDYCFVLLYTDKHFFITTLHGPRRKRSLYC
jgi:hypothetical protein